MPEIEVRADVAELISIAVGVAPERITDDEHAIGARMPKTLGARI
jgi:hypothetical protein